MSMGRSEKKQKLEIRKFDQIRYATKKIAEHFFKEPLYYSFYGMLTITVIGLFFGMKLPIPYYIILILLSANEVYNKFIKK